MSSVKYVCICNNVLVKTGKNTITATREKLKACGITAYIKIVNIYSCKSMQMNYFY